MCKWNGFHRHMHDAIDGFWRDVHWKLNTILLLVLVGELVAAAWIIFGG